MVALITEYTIIQALVMFVVLQEILTSTKL
jgi:hypothetical protein